MFDFVQRIYDFNKDNGLLDKGYSDFLESSFQIEEALEGFDIKEVSQNTTDYRLTTSSAKELSRYILDREKFIGTDVDRLDKACDAIVFAVGSMAKLGLTPSQIHEALTFAPGTRVTELKDTEGIVIDRAIVPIIGEA